MNRLRIFLFSVSLITSFNLSAANVSEAFQSCRGNANIAYNGNPGSYVGSTCTVQGNSVNFLLGSNGSNLGFFPFDACTSGTSPQITGSSTVLIPVGSSAACQANCLSNSSWNQLAGSCVCNSGYVMSGGSCVAQPPDCSASQVDTLCSGTICTGSYQGAFTCWLSSASAPSGCESGVKSFSGCPAVCLGDSTEDPVTHQCIDPTCSSTQYLKNHTCVDDPVCVGAQSLVDHQCVDPTCEPGQTLNSTTHQCDDPICIGGQTLNLATHSCDEPVCNTGYTVNLSTHICEFSGCPSGFVVGQVNGVTSCVKSGATSSGTSETTETTTETQTSTSTTNPDGTTSTTTSGTQTTSGSTTISLDTGGLAQESTVREIAENSKGILDKLNEAGPTFENGGDDLYTSEGVNTYQQIFDDFKARVGASNIGAAATGIFTVSVGGSCPIWTIPATALTPSLTIDQMCSGAMNDVWPIIRAVLAAVATFLAIRVAFL